MPLPLVRPHSTRQGTELNNDCVAAGNTREGRLWCLFLFYLFMSFICIFPFYLLMSFLFLSVLPSHVFPINLACSFLKKPKLSTSSKALKLFVLLFTLFLLPLFLITWPGLDEDFSPGVKSSWRKRRRRKCIISCSSFSVYFTPTSVLKTVLGTLKNINLSV